jgi:hypothetical protein
MSTNLLCDPYLWENPLIIFKTSPFKTVAHSCASELVNQAFVIILIFTAFGAIVSAAMKNIYGVLGGFCVGLLFAVPNIVNLIYLRKQSENFADAGKTIGERNGEAVKNAEKARHNLEELHPAVGVIGSKNSGIQSQPYKTSPSARNPFMNVLIDEIKYNPTRAPAANGTNPLVNMQLDDFFHTQFVNDPTDVFNTTQSQRQFYTTPSTTVPNDQDSYQNWLYRIPGKTCKEGGREACAAQTGSAGGAIPWLNSSN